MDPNTRVGSEESVFSKKSSSTDSIKDLVSQLENPVTLANQFAPRDSMENLRKEREIALGIKFEEAPLGTVYEDSEKVIDIILKSSTNPRFMQTTIHPYKLQIGDKDQTLIIILDEDLQKRANLNWLKHEAAVLHRACVLSLFLDNNDSRLKPHIERLLKQYPSLKDDIKKLPIDTKKIRGARAAMHRKYVFPAVNILQTALKK